MTPRVFEKYVGGGDVARMYILAEMAQRGTVSGATIDRVEICPCTSFEAQKMRDYGWVEVGQYSRGF